MGRCAPFLQRKTGHLAVLVKTSLPLDLVEEPMIVVKNRLPVTAGREQEFEEKFQARARQVESAPGFLKLEILRPVPRVKNEDGNWQNDSPAVLHYEVRSYWDSLDAFDAWKKSEAFSGAHQRVLDKKGQPAAHKLETGLLAGRPEIEFHQVWVTSNSE